MKKIFFSALVLALLCASLFSQAAVQTAGDACFMPAVSLALPNEKINMTRIEEYKNSGILQYDGNYYYLASAPFGKRIAINANRGYVVVEFESNSSHDIATGLTLLYDMQLLQDNGTLLSGENASPVENASCRIIGLSGANIMPLAAGGTGSAPAAGKPLGSEYDNLPAPNSNAPATGNVPSPNQNAPADSNAQKIGSTPTPEQIGAIQNSYSSTGVENSPASGNGQPPAGKQAGEDMLAPSNAGKQAGYDILIPFLAGAAAVLFVAVMAFYFRKPEMQMHEEFAHEAYIGTTQSAILEQLEEAERIPTDIALRIKKSKSTVVEHLDSLVKQGYVERISNPERKFVFYRLSHFGRQVLIRKKQAA